MTILRIDPDIKIPFERQALLSGDPVQVTEYMLRLVRTLQELLGNLTSVVNLGVDGNDGDAIYIGTKDEDGNYPVGTWRWTKVNSTLQVQEKVTDTGVDADDWVKVGSHSR